MQQQPATEAAPGAENTSKKEWRTAAIPHKLLTNGGKSVMLSTVARRRKLRMPPFILLKTSKTYAAVAE